MKKSLRWVSLLLILFLLGSMFIGCSKDDGDKVDSSNENEKKEEDKKEDEDKKDDGDEIIKLTYWGALNASVAKHVSHLGEVEAVKVWIEKFPNIQITFEHPPTGQEREQFNLMVATQQDLPDLMEFDWLTYPGGPEKAIKDGVIIELNDIIEQNAPNFKTVLQENDLINKQVRTDEGTLYVFPAYSGSRYSISGGLVLRKDWLDELNLSVPETIDDWGNVLRDFKERKSSPAPLTVTVSNILNTEGVFNSAFNVGKDFYIENDKIMYGPIQPEYKDFIQLMKDWYVEGFIDPDFASNDSKAVDANIIEGRSGAVFAYIGGGMGNYFNAMKDDQSFDLIGAQFPVMNKGEAPLFLPRPWEYRGGGSLAITIANRFPAESAALIDYLYSEEGAYLKNFGVEGMTYNMEDGYPRYSDLILNNPDGLSMGEAMGKYTRGSYPTPGYIDGRYHEQYFKLPQQLATADLWAKVADNAIEVLVPPIIHSAEESEEISTIMATVDSYRQEMAVKFIMGQEPLENFDKYIDEMEKMDIKRAINLKQAAFERYKNR